MADIFISVPKVPWHCEHRVDKAKCEKCREASNGKSDK